MSTENTPKERRQKLIDKGHSRVHGRLTHGGRNEAVFLALKRHTEKLWDQQEAGRGLAGSPRENKKRAGNWSTV